MPSCLVKRQVLKQFLIADNKLLESEEGFVVHSDGWVQFGWITNELPASEKLEAPEV